MIKVSLGGAVGVHAKEVSKVLIYLLNSIIMLKPFSSAVPKSLKSIAKLSFCSKLIGVLLLLLRLLVLLFLILVHFLTLY